LLLVNLLASDKTNVTVLGDLTSKLTVAGVAVPATVKA
jgi:hypothetical protein